jgi:hypothetical protein
MKVKKMVKRLFAVGAGAAMLGATAMGALAADLSTYPDMFVEDGKFNGVFVVGENAKAIDNLAAIDIATSMKYVKSTGASTTSVSGDNWRVATSAKKLEMANNNATASAVGAETFRDINTFIGEDELGALADGEWKTNENTYGYQQFLFFDDTGDKSVSRIVKYSEDDDDATADHLFIKSGRQIARYKMEFTSTAQSDVTDSTGTDDTTGSYLDDFENTDFSMMGQSYSVVLARRVSAAPTGLSEGVKLTLMGGSTSDTLLEGETQTYTVGDVSYEVTLTFVDDTNGKFVVNGESTNKLSVGETHILSDGSEIGVSEVLYQSYAGGVHSVDFFVGASKVVLQDTDVTAVNTGDKPLVVGSEEIDGTNVAITGTDDNATFAISTIEINMTADDDFFVGVGEMLSEVVTATGEEQEVLMNGGFNIEYHGLEDAESHELRLKSSSSRRYRLQLFDGDGNSVDLPVAYAESATNMSIGEDTGVGVSASNKKKLHLNETQFSSVAAGLYNSTEIYKDDYFVVTGGTSSDGSAKSYLLQYRGSDKSSDTSPKIKFKNMGSSETLEYSATTSGTSVVDVATIKLGGYSFLVRNASTQAVDDYAIHADFNGDGTLAVSTAPAANVAFVDSYGSSWAMTGLNSTGHYWGVSTITWTQTTPNGDDYDNSVPANIGITVTPTTGPELRAATPSGLTFVTPDGETEISYGYTTMGTKVTMSEPASDPDEVILAYPASQALPQVYFTSGATSTSKSASGDMAAVEIVDATKLDSEVSDAMAQNVVAVGGPCANTVAASLLGNPADCAEGFAPGKARIKYWEHANGNVAMLVAGFSGEDTRLAGKVIAHRASEMSGGEVEVEGTTYSTATIGAPSVAAPVVEPVVDTTTE